MPLQTDTPNSLEVTSPISLKEFFEGKPLDKSEGEENLALRPVARKIEIPRIQRSYAQGRVTDRINEKRRRFLESLHGDLAVRKPITLDFVYGNILDDKLIPLDGQQRLTTLFLLHWYASRHADKAAREHVMFRKEQFNYMTRYSSRDFLTQLVEFQPNLADGHPALSKQITEEEGWFAVEWRKDPTISSMLVMLDAIDAGFSDIAGDLWDRLDGVNFYLLDVNSMNATDDIYVRMNSRGRELTSFEHFKAELLKSILKAGVSEEIQERISLKFDVAWTEMLWKYRDENNLVDGAFLRMFRFICMLITYRDRNETFTTKGDEFSLVREYFSVEDADDSLQRGFVLKNILLLERIFDIWTGVGDIDAFFARFIEPTENGHRAGKILDCWLSERRLSGEADRKRFSWTNPFRSWLHSSTNAYRLFSILYIFTVVLDKNPGIVDTDYFRRRLRIMSNMIKNTSEREIADSPNSDSGNRMPTILRQIEEVMLQPTFTIFPASLNQVAMEEEAAKWSYTTDRLSLTDAGKLFELEDHPLLDGMVGVVDYTRPSRYSTFHAMFDPGLCNRSNLERALLAHGDYTIDNGGGYRRMAAEWDKVWYDFLRSLYADFRGNDRNKRSREIFQSFLDCNPAPSDRSLAEKIETFLDDCRNSDSYDWRYYYISYPPFRRRRWGLITLDYTLPYASFLTHFTQKYWSNNSEQPFLKTVVGAAYDKETDLKRQFLPALGKITGSDGGWLTCANDAWEIYDSAEAEVPVRRILVPQSPAGVDLTDRILLLRRSLNDIDEKVIIFSSRKVPNECQNGLA